MAEGRIQKALSGFYYVDTGAEVLTCRARGKFRKEGLSPLDVFDHVQRQEVIAEDREHDIQDDQRGRRQQLLHIQLFLT